MSLPPRYRWVVLLTGAAGAAAFAGLRMGLPALAPAMRDAYGVTLSQIGLAFAAVAAGTMITLAPWGVLSDRIGERPVMASGLAGCALALVGAAFTTSYAALLLALLVAGMLGASATGASGRAIMGWFERDERGFALGLRQMALPLGGGLASLALPLVVHLDGLRGAFGVLAAACLLAAVASAALLRDPPPTPKALRALQSRAPARDQRLWRLGAGAALMIAAQSSVLGFVVLFLHDARGLSVGASAAALAAIQLGGAGARLVAGRRSDREGLRIAPLRRIAARNAILVAATALLAGAPGAVLYPVLACTAVSVMSWNGLSFTAAGEIAGRERAGTAMGVQSTILTIGGIIAPISFGVLVETASWTVAYAVLAVAPMLAYGVLRPLEGDEDERVAVRAERLRAAAEERAALEAVEAAS